MARFILNRLIQSIGVICLVFIAVFLLSRWVPGGPFIEEKEGSAAALEEKKAFYHFDKPIHEQFYYLVKDWFAGSLNSIMQPDQTVQELIAQSLPVSLTLGWFALILAVFFGVLFGVIVSIQPRSAVDILVLSFTLLGLCLPNFVIGAILIVGFGFLFPILPVAGWGQFPHLILPAITLSLPVMATIIRLTRASMLEVLRSDCIRTHRAYGFAEGDIVFKWALKNAFIPVLTYLAPAAAGILTGSIVIESLYAIPGIGQFFVQSVLNHDYNVLLGTVFIYSCMIVLFNLLVDILYSFMDPRIRLTK